MRIDTEVTAVDAQGLQERYNELLVGLIRDEKHPSPAIMERAESGIRDYDAAVDYIGALIDKCEDDLPYPSLTMLDRIARLLRQLEPAPG